MSQPIQNNRIAERIQSPIAPAAKAPIAPAGQTAFSEVLSSKLKVSGHAATRLQSRNIQLDESAWERVLEGVERAAAKGAKESLVMVDDVALVVSVKNRTVITAVDQQHLKENVFTNIDSAVIV